MIVLGEDMLQNSEKCSVCGKGSVVGNNKPHSLHKTKRVIKPNLQIKNNELVCTKCIKTQTICR